MKIYYLVIVLLCLLQPVTGQGQIQYDDKLYNTSGESLYPEADHYSSNPLSEQSFSTHLVDEKNAPTTLESDVFYKPFIISNTNDFFRSSVISGNWNDVASWESSPDNSTWSSATLVPTSAAQTITVQAGHTIIVNSGISLDETIIQGILELQTGSILTINDGIGSDIDIFSGGVINVKNSSANNYSSMISQAATASINIGTNGKIAILGDGATVATGLQGFATNTSNAWNDGAVFEWNCGAVPLISNLTYFPNAVATIPIFRVTAVGGPITGGSPFVLNGLLDLLTDVGFSGGGSKTLRDGISSAASTVTFNASASGTLSIGSSTAKLSGTLTIVLNKTLNLTTNVVVPTGSTVIIDNTSLSNIAKGAGLIFNVAANAIFDIGYNCSISNTTGSVDIFGTFRTGNASGFSGGGSSIVSGTVNLNAGCTVELNRNDGTNQALTSRADFKNLTFSGSGTKSISSACNPAGTVLIKDDAILDVLNHSFGDAGTNLTMTDNSRFKTAGTGTKPDIQGTYSLGAGTTIEFTNSVAGQQNIRVLGVNYYNIDVSGTNVGNASTSTSIQIQNLGKFQISSGAIFKVANTSGFSSVANAAISSSGITVFLAPTSTIDYNGTGATQNITGIMEYPNLSISGTGTKIAPIEIPGFPLVIHGNLVKSGSSIFDHNNASIKFSNATSPQSFTNTGSTPFVFYNLINNNTESASGLSILNDLNIENGFTLSSGSKLSLTSGNIILFSDNNKTAYVDEVTGSVSVSYGTGKFVVQRYLPIATTSAARRWRLLTAPLKATNAPTINAAWQEGQFNVNRSIPQNANPGFGTIITRGTTAINGYDQGSTGNPSIYKYTAGAWAPLAGTNSGAITDELGYMIFVRGDRNMIISGPSVAGSPTTLQAKGEINIGTVTIPLNPAGFKLIGNPYASAISFNDVLVNGVNPSTTAGVTFYLWDPKLNGNYGVGGFITCISLGGGVYSVTANSSGYPTDDSFTGIIESGAAFMMPVSSGNIVFDESCKLTSSSTVGIASRPAGNNGSGFSTERFTANLLSGDNSVSKVLDGVINIGSDDFDNAVTERDAPKLISFQTAEKLSIVKEGKKLSIELRKKLADNDTIFYALSKLSKGSYQFQFIKKLIAPHLTAILEDHFTGQQTVMPANDSVAVSFSVTEDSGSFATDRFRVLFSSSVKYHLLSASIVKKDVEVKWQVAPEYNVSHYEIQRSFNGILFTALGSKQGIGNSNAIVNYTWLDKEPAPGIYYYRIKAVTTTGAKIYSDIKKVTVFNSSTEMYVFPNPVTGKNIQLQMNDQPAGKYDARLINNQGQALMNKTIYHPGGTATQTIEPPGVLPDGIYQLEITSPGKKTTSIRIMVKK